MDANNRGLKNRVSFSSTLDKDLHESWTDLSKETRINKSRLLDEAMQDLLKKYGKIKDKK